MKAKKVLNLLKENAIDGINDEIGKIWVVTAPTESSEMLDIVFEVNIGSLMNQARGGLDPDDVLMLTKDQKKAEAYGKKLLGETRG